MFGGGRSDGLAGTWAGRSCLPEQGVVVVLTPWSCYRGGDGIEVERKERMFDSETGPSLNGLCCFRLI